MSKSATPSEKTVRKLNALRVLTTKVYHPLDIAETLVKEGIMTDREMLEMRATADKTEFLFVALEKASRSGKLDLLDYSWQILPTQQVVLTILTSTGLHEFRHEEP
jgi:hypothetical protein